MLGYSNKISNYRCEALKKMNLSNYRHHNVNFLRIESQLGIANTLDRVHCRTTLFQSTTSIMGQLNCVFLHK